MMSKILFLTFDIRYINPTRELLLKALGAACDLDLFGPGFQNGSELDRGPQAYLDRHGPYDLVLADEFVLQDFHKAQRGAILRFVNHACSFDRDLFMYGERFKEFLSTYSGRKGIFLSQTDYYCFPQHRLDLVEGIFDYVFGWGEELIAPRNVVISEEAGQPVLSPVDREVLSRWTDRYRNFLLAHPERIISMPHLIDDAEFSDRQLRGRKPWVVIGADYTERMNARAALDMAGIMRTGKAQPYLFSMFQKFHINPYAHSWSIDILQRQFKLALVRAKYAYTCGAIVRCAIRKYFEIPAAGCVLVADRCEGFEALGFRDRHNALLAKGSEVLDAHRWLSELDDAGQGIANQGRDLIRQQHSISARGRQLSAAFEAISSGRFAGSKWVDGKFMLRLTDGTALPV